MQFQLEFFVQIMYKIIFSLSFKQEANAIERKGISTPPSTIAL